MTREVSSELERAALDVGDREDELDYAVVERVYGVLPSQRRKARDHACARAREEEAPGD